MANNGSEQASNEVNKVAIKVPPFWSSNPSLWFRQLEIQFALNGITADMTKFYYAMSQLELKYLQEVEDVVNNLPATGKYDRFKDELIRRLSKSEEQRIKQLLEQEEIGDRTPSQFLRHLKTLAGDNTLSENFLRTMWLNRLPASMRTVLATRMDEPVDKMATLADKINEITPIGHCAAVTPNPEIAALCEQITRLTQEVAELKMNQRQSRSNFRGPGRGGWRRGSRNRSRNRSRSRSPSPSQPGVCWYHRRFGDKSTRCTTPCTYVQHQGNEADRR